MQTLGISLQIRRGRNPNLFRSPSAAFAIIANNVSVTAEANYVVDVNIYLARSCQLPPRESPRLAYLPCHDAEISKKSAIATSGNSQGGNITHGVVRYGAILVFVRTDSESTLAFSCQWLMSFNSRTNLRQLSVSHWLNCRQSDNSSSHKQIGMRS